MKKIFLTLFLFVLAMSIPAVALAQGDQVLGLTKKAQEIKNSMNGGPHFRAGDTVMINETLEGDVYAAGGNVVIDGSIFGDLIVAGGTVDINGEITDDIRVAGGTVNISGHVGKNITVMGGTVNLDTSSVVGGSVVAAGGTVSLDGQVAGNVVSAGGTVALTGEFAGNVQVESDSVIVGKDVEISGNFIANYETSADVNDAATIVGETNIQREERVGKPKKDIVQGISKFLVWAKLVGMATGVLMGLVGGSVFIYLFPSVIRELSKSAANNPMSSLGWGFIQLIMMPVISIILIITVLGLPLAGVIFLFYLLTLILSCWLAALITGKKIFELSKLKFLENTYVQLFIGLVILQILSLIPIVGWLLRFIIFLTALGSILIFTKSRLRKEGKKKK